MVGDMEVMVIIGRVETTIGSDTGTTTAMLLRCQREVSMNHAEARTTIPDRKRIHDSVRVVIRMTRKKTDAREGCRVLMLITKCLYWMTYYAPKSELCMFHELQK